jgi:hypothetical protein
MDDVIGVRVRDAKRGWVGFVTYGRLWDRVDPANELAAISAHFSTFGIKEPVDVRLCDSLQELASAKYFYEALLTFAWQPVPFGPGYEAWRAEMRSAVENGKHIFYVGEIQDAAESWNLRPK